MKVIAVIPVFGRESLLIHTINRLYKENKVDHVICVGNRFSDQIICETLDCEWIQCSNEYLGTKWNTGLLEAKKYDPEYILFTGSSDWMSKDWVSTLYDYANKNDLDMVGKKDLYWLDIGVHNHKRLCYWKGYKQEERLNEPIGLGRLYSNRILDKCKWRLFDDKANHNMDWTSMQNVIKANGKIGLYRGNEIHGVSISTYKWVNKHKFDQLLKDSYVVGFEELNVFINANYPEANQLFNK